MSVLEPIPDAVALPRRRRNLQLVWLVPALAALIAVVLGLRVWLSSGPTVTITFASAEGLEQGKTRIRYKNVDIGLVKKVSLSSDRKTVLVSAAMTKDAETLLLDDTRFWIVRPRFVGGEVTGLSTLLSGAYIGVDVGKAADERRSFTGLDIPPSVTADEPGREYVLRSADLGSLDIGSPVYFRRAEVGKVTTIGLDADGKGVTLKVFVRSPHERYVTENTRFWHASGVDLSLDASGVKLQAQSLVTLLLGGVAFGHPEAAPAAAQAKADAAFKLFNDQALAMKRGEAEMTPLLAYFTGSMRGLSPGAPVDFRGVVVGEVKSVEVSFDAQGKEVRFPVEMALYRDLIGSKLGAGGQASDTESLLRRSIEHGLRAQLRTGNLLTGQRFVALDFVNLAALPKEKKAPKQAMVAAPSGRIEIPTNPGSLEDLQATLTHIAKTIEKVPFDQIAADLQGSLKSLNSVLAKIDKVPLEEVATDLRGTLKTLDASLRSAEKVMRQVDQDLAPGLNATITETRQTMKAANQLLTADAPTQQDLRTTLRELTRTAQSLRELADVLQRRPEALLRGHPVLTRLAPM